MSLPAKHCPHFFAPPTQFGDINRLPQLRNRNQAFGIRPHDDDEDVHGSFKRPKLSNTTISMPKLNTRSIREATPYKTHMCLEFARGRCAFGGCCHFAHSSTEIRKRPSFWKDEVHIKETASSCDQMKLCKWTSNGYEYTYGNKCYYRNDGRRSCAIDIGTAGGELKRSGDSSSRADVGYWCWKTKLCHNWQATKNCPYGSKCRFAHGKAELRNSEVKYRNLSSAITLVGPAKDEAYKKYCGDNKDQQVDGQGFLIRLKGVKKFIGIYADWIGDSTSGV